MSEDFGDVGVLGPDFNDSFVLGQDIVDLGHDFDVFVFWVHVLNDCGCLWGIIFVILQKVLGGLCRVESFQTCLFTIRCCIRDADYGGLMLAI